jgi:HD-GYP domain-containing protein (c-di-GMP phosphodiesterase class II)
MKQWLIDNGGSWVAFLQSYQLELWAALLLLTAFSILIVLIQQRRVRESRSRAQQVMRLMETIQPSKSLDKNLNELLEQVASLVDAPSYAFYLLDSKHKQYMLKTVRHRSEPEAAQERGDKGKKKETYLPPLSVPADTIADESLLYQVVGEVPLLSVTVGKQLGLLRIGPLRRAPKKRIRRLLTVLSGQMSHVLEHLISSEKLRNESEVVLSAGRGLQQISKVATETKVTLDFISKLAVQALNASGGCLFLQHSSGVAESFPTGITAEQAQGIVRTPELADQLRQLLGSEAQIVLQSDDARLSILPAQLRGMNADTWFLMDPRIAEGRGLFLFWFTQRPDVEDLQVGAFHTLRMVLQDMYGLIGHQSSLHRLSGTYTNILKTLARQLDNISVYSVGYSELMSRYSIVIAKELGLEDAVIKDIALAAYLSNIGVLGISIDLYQKEGKFTDQEFELMKLHAEVGASIVRATTGNERVASYIMYHHERMDGNGYPSGLRGAEIPVGAKIIAVVQTFLAKINGRKYRSPLSFHQALQTLRAASGTQLDPKIVEAFIKWFQRKQADPAFQARSLGSCWEMACVPSSICEHCPAYGRTDVNCWELPANNCKAHGKSCDTCFVRTEFTTRKEAFK